MQSPFLGSLGVTLDDFPLVVSRPIRFVSKCIKNTTIFLGEDPQTPLYGSLGITLNDFPMLQMASKRIKYTKIFLEEDNVKSFKFFAGIHFE